MNETTTSKVAYKNVVNATVRVDNSVDAERVYDIAADVNVQNGMVQNVNGGEVKRKGEANQAATFNSWGDLNLQVNFVNIPSSEYADVLEAINAFVADAKETAGNFSIDN